MTRWGLMAAVGLLALVGCTAIPTSGPVEEVTASLPPREVDFAPEPPQDGVTPERLVEGFLQAMVDPDADYSVARQYLTADVAQTWQPSAATTIYEGSVEVAEDASSAVLSGTTVGRLDEAGHFHTDGTELSHEFMLVQEDGQWRITHPPEGVLMSQFSFNRFYAHVSTYFVAQAGTHVVPEQIHVPDALLTPNRIIQAQLAGPGEEIAGAVRNALPSTAELTDEGASVDQDGTVRVHLTGVPADLPEDRRRELGAQLVWSLSAVPRVTGLALFVDGGAYGLPGQDANGVLDFASQQGFQVFSRAASADLFGISGGVAGRLTSSGAFLPIAALASYEAAEVALALDGTEVATILAGRNELIVGAMGGEAAPLALELTNLRSLHFSLGQIWLLGESADGSTKLVRIDGQGVAHEVDLSQIPGDVARASVSPVGVLVALVLDDGGFGVATFTGDELSHWNRLSGTEAAPLTTAYDCDWSEEYGIAVLATSNDRRTVLLTSADGAVVEDLGPIGVDATQLSALPRITRDAIAVRDADAQVLRNEATGLWTPVPTSLTDVSYPG
ncbi:MAG: GerMN domain-containing protein [Arachnia sp.]